jgi:hypothetical protein
MAKKKERAFFVCPAWDELTDAAAKADPTAAKRLQIHAKHLAAIKAGQPMVRSTLRRALMAMQKASGTMFDVDAHIVDQRSAPTS